jgi:hypothetical protein
MSLIVDINPVPWKILDLVRARILKNRATKAKKGMDWSKETLRREMSLQSAPLISRRKDEPNFVSSQEAYVVVGWFANNNVTSDNYSSSVSCSIARNVPIPGASAGNNFDTTRTCNGVDLYSGTCTIEYRIGSGNAENWITDTVSFNYATSAQKVEYREYLNTIATGIPNDWRVIDGTINGSGNSSFLIYWSMLPSGEDSMVLFVAIVQRSASYSTVFYYPATGQTSGTYLGERSTTIVNLKTYKISNDSVTRLQAAIPKFMQDRIKYDDEAFGNSLLGISDDGEVDDRFVYQSSNIGFNNPYPTNSSGTYISSSASFLMIKNYTWANQLNFSKEEALQDYRAVTGSDQIPVLGYRRVSNGRPNPLVEEGVFGIIPGATVYSQLLPTTTLNDEVDQRPSANAVAPGADHLMLITYDYHGGTYCSDQLSQLGINI